MHTATLGLVQTAYANGNSTRFLKDKLVGHSENVHSDEHFVSSHVAGLVNISGYQSAVC